MPKPYRPRIRIKEQTSDKASVKKRSSNAITLLKNREGYIGNPKDKSESLYRKGDRKRPNEGTSSNRYRKPAPKKRVVRRRTK